MLINGEMTMMEEDAKQGREDFVKKNRYSEICKPHKQKLNINLFENRYSRMMSKLIMSQTTSRIIKICSSLVVTHFSIKIVLSKVDRLPKYYKAFFNLYIENIKINTIILLRPIKRNSEYNLRLQKPTCRE